METVKYRNKTYVVSRYVDKEDEKLLTPQKQRIAKLYEKYEVIPETNKYTNAYKVIYPFMRQFMFYENLMSEGGFGDGSGK